MKEDRLFFVIMESVFFHTGSLVLLCPIICFPVPRYRIDDRLQKIEVALA
jgi:hypothetical protein